MTKYDKLMDAIKDHLYRWYSSGANNDGWDESEANEDAHAILQAVEEFQSSPSAQRWRATD